MTRPLIRIVQKRLPAPRLMWRIDMVVFSFTIVVLLYLFMIVSGYPYANHVSGVEPDLPRVYNPIALQDAARGDAIVVAITRDNKIYFGRRQIEPRYLAVAVRSSLYAGSKPEIFFLVDARAKTGRFLEAFDAVRSIHVQRIAFLANKRLRGSPL